MNFKNKLKYVFIIILSVFLIQNNKVNADENRTMYLECSYPEGNYVFVWVKHDNEYNGILNNNFFKDVVSEGNFQYEIYKKDDNFGKENYQLDIEQWAKSNSNIDVKKLDSNLKYSALDVLENINEGYCPEMIIPKGLSLYLSGKSLDNAVKNVKVSPNFLIYSKGKFDYIEGYTKNGRYILLKRGSNGKIEDEGGGKYQHVSLQQYKEYCFNLNKYPLARAIPDSEIKLASHKIPEYIDEWFKKGYGGPLGKQLESANKIKQEYSELYSSCKNIKKDKSNFDLNMQDEIIKKLNESYLVLDDFYNNGTFNYKLCSSNKETNDYMSSIYDCTMYNKIGYTDIDYKTGSKIVNIMVENINKEMKNRNINSSYINDIQNYLSTFYECSIVVDSFKDDLTSANMDKIKEIRKNYEKLANSQRINVSIDCESLIGQDLIDKIDGYLDIVKILIPILLIGFGIYDFGSAMLSGDDDKMNKAKQQFIKRIIISILIFLTPVFVNLLLRLANIVWSNISPSSCGLF